MELRAVSMPNVGRDRSGPGQGSARTGDPLESTVELGLFALGLAKERAGDFEGAARDLLRAAEVDRQYLPAWTLANFYFRRGDRPAFRNWVRRSAELAPGDLGDPLLIAV